MAIIYSYPTVQPTSDDLILGTDINAEGKPTKNFTIQSIVDIVQGGAAGLGAVIKINPSAKDPATAANQSAIDFLNISGTGTASFGVLSDGTLQITGGNLTTTGNGIFNQITGTLQTAAQPNVTSLGTLTSLIVNTSVTGTAVVTTLAAPGDDLKIASTKAIIDYIATKPNKETLAETLVAGQITGGKDIIVSAGDDITFTDTSKIILGTGSDATIEHDGTDLKILNTLGKTTISNSSGDIDISATAAAKKLNLNGKAGVELKFDGNKQFETILNGSIATGTFNATGLLTAQTNLWFKDKIGIGGAGAPNYGTSGQVLSSGGALGDATWEDLTPLYTWIIQADSGTGRPYTVASGDTIDFVGGDNINTSWVNAGKELKIDATGLVQKGTGAATQVAYWTDANTIAGDAGMIYDAANDYLTLAGTVKSGTFTTTAGTATWTTTVLDDFTSITSDLFVGDATAATVPSSPPWPANPTANVQFQGNASSANILKLTGAVSLSTGAAPSAGAENTQGVSSVAGQTYTSGGNITIETTLASTVATAKRLTNLSTTTSTAVVATDTILEGIGKLQAQISGLPSGLDYIGAWAASTTAVTDGAQSSSTDLVIATGDDNLVIGTIVEGTATAGTIRIATVTNNKTFVLDTAIDVGDGVTLTMSPPGGIITGATAGTDASLTTATNKSPGHYYICNVAGKAEPNAAVPWSAQTQPSEWGVGDWVIYSDAPNNRWEKIDNTSVVDGTGAANKIARWTGPQTLGTGLISDDGSIVTIGDTGSLSVLGNATFGNADTDTVLAKGPVTLNETLNIKKGIEVNSAAGTSGQVLTSGAGSGAVMSWTTPTTGTVESVSSGDGIILTGDAVDPVVNVDYVGTDNVILSAGTAVTPVGADTIIINDATTGNVVKALISGLPFDAYNKWVLTGDTGTQDILSGNTVDIAGGTYITTAAAATDTLTINHDATSRTSNTDTSSPAFGDDIDVFDTLTTNGTGHVTITNLKTITLPSPVNFTAGTAPGAGTPAAGTAGYVPAPAAGTGSTAYFLNGTGTMTVPPNDQGVTSVTATAPISSSGGNTPNITHDTSGVSAGTYDIVTVDNKGHVTTGSNTTKLTASCSKSLSLAASWTPMFALQSSLGMGKISEVWVNKVIATVAGGGALSAQVAQAGISGTWSGSADSQTATNIVYNTIIDTANGELEVRFVSYNPSSNVAGYKCEARVLNTQGTVEITVTWNNVNTSIYPTTFTDLT
jgi:hypothetical protein